MKIVVCSYGSIARRHIDNCQMLWPEASISLLRRTSGPTEERHATLQQFTQLTEATTPAPDLAIICSPAPLHLEQLTAFATAGAACYLEKPVAPAVPEEQQLQNLLTRCNTAQVIVGYNLRYHACVQLAKGIIAAGELGHIYGGRFHVGQWLPDWRPHTDYRDTATACKDLGGGALLELSHEFDLARYLLGDMTSVTGFTSGSGLLDIDVEDRVDAVCATQSGAQISIHCDLLQRDVERTITITGSQGTLRLDLLSGQATISKAGEPSTDISPPPQEANDMYRRALSATMTTNHTAGSCSLTDGLRTLAVVDAIRRAADTGMRQDII